MRATMQGTAPALGRLPAARASWPAVSSPPAISRARDARPGSLQRKPSQLQPAATATATAVSRRCCRVVAQAASSDADQEAAQAEAARERRFVRALLLSFHASQNRSLFATKCMVEVVTQMYREGLTLNDAVVMLSLAGLQQGGQLLEPMDEDVLLSWVAVVMLALEIVGVPLLPEGEERLRRKAQEGAAAEDNSRMSVGLKAFVKMAVDQFLAGTDLYRLQLQQSMAGDQAGEGGLSPSVRLMQQNTRLVIIALEVVRGSNLPTSIPLHQPQPAGGEEGEPQPQQQPAAASGSVVPGFVLSCDPERLSTCSEEAQQRAMAVRLLISFMGAATGWLYPAYDFCQCCIDSYSKGWTADDLYAKLHDEEFAQSGGLLIDFARQPATGHVSSLVFSRWISLCYMAQAQLGSAFPGAAVQDGWAWVSGSAAAHDGGESTTLEAYGLADFVVHTIRNAEEQERAARLLSGSSSSGSSGGSGSGGGGGGEEDAQRVEGVLARPPPADLQQPQEGFVGFVILEDPEMGTSSPTALLMSQQISLIRMTRLLVLQERAAAAASVEA